MKIGFLIIASEVLDGRITDANTKILADFLKINHLEIERAIIARDDKKSIEDALESLFSNCELVVSCGGLGPTKDDITKETMASFLCRKMSYSDDAYNISLANYKRFDRPFPGKDHGYCYLPEGFIPLNNATGFAPGFYTEHGDKILFCAPGVPRELKSILEEHLMRILDSRLRKDSLLGSLVFRTKKVPEEKIFNEVDPELWNKLEKFGVVSSLPVLMGVDIGVKIQAKNNDQMAAKVSDIKKVMDESPIKPYVWHIGPETIEEKIVVLANQKKVRFGFAESATGGLVSHRITNISGCSETFMGSVICYDEKIKEHILNVRPETLKNCSAVSLECAKEMAEGLKNNFSLDIAISITGFAGPGGGNDKYPVGTVCIGKSLQRGDTSAEHFVFKGDRELLKLRFSQAALHVLLEELEKFA